MKEFFTKEINLFGGNFVVWHVIGVAVIVLLLAVVLISLLAKRKKAQKAKADEPEVVEPKAVESKAVESKAVEPEVVEPKAVESKAVEPEVVEPEAFEPEVVEPEVVEPKVVKPEVVEPEVVEPKVVKPEVVKPEVVKPKAVKPEVVEPEVVESKKSVVRGKFEISLRSEGYHFSLIANNGQFLYDSFGFASLQGAKGGIETFKKSVEEGKFAIYKDKFDRFRYVLNKRYVGENYTNKNSCESSVNSVKRFTPTAVINDYVRDEKAEKQYNEFKKNIKIITDEEWNDEIEKEYKPSGKYYIVKEDDGYRFYLVANNGQLLYSSRAYIAADGAAAGINSFKRAVFSANFYIDEDKFGKFRFIVRGGGSLIYVGESFSTKKSAVNNAESVKNFAMSAILVPYVEE